MEKAIFGGGCFWCTEAVFKSLKGVKTVKSGYAGGNTQDHPTYMQIASGKTGHAEVVYIEYDPKKVSYRDLLIVFFGSHDPTTLNKQGSDVGTQYRSVVLYTTEDQKNEAEKIIKEINSEGDPVVTEVVPFDKFYEADAYHKDYYERNESAPYCQIIINPKLEKVKKQFAELLKENSK